MFEEAQVPDPPSISKPKTEFKWGLFKITQSGSSYDLYVSHYQDELQTSYPLRDLLITAKLHARLDTISLFLIYRPFRATMAETLIYILTRWLPKNLYDVCTPKVKMKN